MTGIAIGVRAPDTPPCALRTREVGIAMPAGARLDIRPGGGGGRGDPATRPAGLEQET